MKTHNTKNKIKESQLRSTIRNILNEIYMNNYIDPEDKEYEMNSDWEDIDSYGTQYPTEGAYDLGDNPYGYSDMDADDIYDRDEANGNAIDDYGYHGMRAMDRGIKSKVDRDKYSKGNLWTGRRARGENPYGDTTFNDEIDKLGLNIEKENLNEAITPSGYEIMDIINMLKEALFDIKEKTSTNKSLGFDLAIAINTINNAIKLLQKYS